MSHFDKLRQCDLPQVRHREGHRYAHDEADGYAAGERYLPEELGERRYYQPVSRGLKIKIGEKLEELRRRDREVEPGRR
jgi:putative ATPase